MCLLDAISPTTRLLMKTQTWLEELKTPVATLLPVDADLNVVQQRFLKLYYEQKQYLASKPTGFLEDLLNHAEMHRRASELSVRASAEINYAACHFLLEERKGGKR